jgi:hypothetical protein
MKALKLKREFLPWTIVYMPVIRPGSHDTSKPVPTGNAATFSLATIIESSIRSTSRIPYWQKKLGAKNSSGVVWFAENRLRLDCGSTAARLTFIGKSSDVGWVVSLRGVSSIDM